ncbi:hypothetical protein LCGC14_2354870, partial [marine sediment metagenome]
TKGVKYTGMLCFLHIKHINFPKGPNSFTIKITL